MDRIKRARMAIVWLALLLGLTPALMCKPQHLGDGRHYFLMLQSLFNHASLDLRLEDARAVSRIYREDLGIRYDLDGLVNEHGYHLAASGGKYCDHFGTYAAISLPAKTLLWALNLGEGRAFFLTNALCLAGLFLFVLWSAGFNGWKKFVLMLSIFLNPILWFVDKSTPETFLYCLTVISYLRLAEGAFFLPVFLTSVVASQNQAAVLLPVLLVAVNAGKLWKQALGGGLKAGAKILAGLTIALLPAVIAPLFYIWKFGAPSIIPDVSLHFISVRRLMEIVWDPNIGLFFYLPLSCVIGGLAWGHAMILLARGGGSPPRRDTAGVQPDPARLVSILGVATLLELAAVTTTGNWNHGTIGPLRYTTWTLLPFCLLAPFLLYRSLSGTPNRRLLGSLSLALAVNTLITATGFFYYVPSCLDESLAARWILERYPGWYNPSEIIFAKRAAHRHIINLRESGLFPIIYRGGDNRCRKALTIQGRDFKGLLERMCPAQIWRTDVCRNGYCYWSSSS